MHMKFMFLAYYSNSNSPNIKTHVLYSILPFFYLTIIIFMRYESNAFFVVLELFSCKLVTFQLHE